MRNIVIPESIAAGYEFPADLSVAYSDDLADVPLDVMNDAHFIVLPYLGSSIGMDEIIRRSPNAQVIQTLTAGFDSVLPHIPDGVTLCNLSRVHDSSTAELAIALTLSVLRDLARTIHAKANSYWETFFARSLTDKKVLLIGYGEVGKATEKRLLGFECEVTRVASTAREGVHGIDEVLSLVPDADVIILTVPLNEGTRGLVNAEFLHAMKDDSILVNVARGPVVVTDALIAELRTGRISAAVDVTDPEPIPADHELWTVPNLLITPHVGGETDVYEPRARKRIHRQLDLWLSGEPLESVIR